MPPATGSYSMPGIPLESVAYFVFFILFIREDHKTLEKWSDCQSKLREKENLDIRLASQRYDDFIFVHAAAYSKCRVNSQTLPDFIP